MAVTGVAGLTATTAAAEDPTTTCRKALDELEETYGICTWSEQNFRGEMTVLTNFQGTDKCGNLSPTAKSAVNLSDEEHLFYRFTKCQEKNFLTSIEPWESQATFGPSAAAGSWR
ncbi:hypothetical protein [Kitasatospora sp. CB02891]|uniref:hypothetical protein n=1 Tax=Kitasatospora sp. CB02891 TaxID=2020329 RepID=UPI000C26EC60|nr:hypothetical protein [Kitasatospora sp. CB02891]PJN27771.1 hypothetical protein CG736_06045 [Kitasatospora sp. CB02891]